MVDVDINVEDPLVILEQLEDGQHDVIDVAEAAGLALLGVMETPGPVDRDVRRLLVELHGAGHGAAAAQLTKLVQTWGQNICVNKLAKKSTEDIVPSNTGQSSPTLNLWSSLLYSVILSGLMDLRNLM